MFGCCPHVQSPNGTDAGWKIRRDKCFRSCQTLAGHWVGRDPGAAILAITMKTSATRKQTLTELSKLAADPQGRASRYRRVAWIWLLAAILAMAAAIWCQERGDDAAHRDAPPALFAGLFLGMAIYYRSAARQSVIIASVLDPEKIRQGLADE